MPCRTWRRLAAAAQATFGAGTVATSEWLGQQAHVLAHAMDGAEQVLDALRALPTQHAADPGQAAEQQRTALGYLGKRLEQLRYATFQALGYPIGSGAVESATAEGAAERDKLVVEARLKGSGMHWERVHVNPLLALRTIVCSDRWDTAWPQIAAELRAQAARRRGERQAARQARQPAPAAPPATPGGPEPVAAPTGAAESSAGSSGAPGTSAPARAKTFVNGRPTALHPWKRHACLPGGRRALDQLRAHPKS